MDHLCGFPRRRVDDEIPDLMGRLCARVRRLQIAERRADRRAPRREQRAERRAT
jgi:hypothetical protein